MNANFDGLNIFLQKMDKYMENLDMKMDNLVSKIENLEKLQNKPEKGEILYFWYAEHMEIF